MILVYNRSSMRIDAVGKQTTTARSDPDLDDQRVTRGTVVPFVIPSLQSA